MQSRKDLSYRPRGIGRRGGDRLGSVIFGVLVLMLMTSGAASAAPGVLTQLAGTDGCVSEDGSLGECANGKALNDARGVAVSPDGKNVYVASTASNAVAVFSRNKTGVLTQLGGTDGCVSGSGSGGQCADGKALSDAIGVAVSPDGKNVYVASAASDAVAVFSRDKNTGALTQLTGADGCVSESGSLGECADGKALDGARGVAVSPDGKHVYIASVNSDAVAVFSRNKNGTLTQLTGTDGCVSEGGSGGQCADGKALGGAISVTVSPDGKNVYVASSNSDAVAVFSRDKNTGALTQLAATDGCTSGSGSGGQCAEGKALDRALSVAVSPDGKNVYVASQDSSAVAVFSRDKNTGALAQLDGEDGCVSADLTSVECVVGEALGGARGVAVNPDGKNVYVASGFSDAVVVFARDKNTGALNQLNGADGCIKEDGTGGECADGKALVNALSVAVSPDGINVYVASFTSAAVTVFSKGK